MKPTEFCSLAAEDRDYPEQASLRWQSYDANGEPLCALPEDEPAPLSTNAWATLAPLTFHEAILRIVRSQHYLNTENQE